MDTLPSKYAGQCIAMVDDIIVASGKNTSEAYYKARNLYPNKLISLTFVPTEKELITFL